MSPLLLLLLLAPLSATLHLLPEETYRLATSLDATQSFLLPQKTLHTHGVYDIKVQFLSS